MRRKETVMGIEVLISLLKEAGWKESSPGEFVGVAFCAVETMMGDWRRLHPPPKRHTKERTMKSKMYLSIVVIVALISAVLVACGGEPPTPTTIPPTPTLTSTPTPSASEHVELGMAYVEEGQLEEAIIEFEEAIRLDPDHADAHLKLGTAYHKQGKLEEAIAAYKKVVELDPDSATAHSNLGLAYYDQGRLDEAIAAYKKAVELDPDSATAHSNLGLAYAHQGQLDEAVAEYKEAIRLDPNYPAAHHNLGLAHASQGRLDEAIAEYKEAIGIDPDHLGAHIDLGLAYANQGRLDEAIGEWEAAVKINPNHALAHKNLGLAYREQGRTEEAVAELETYLQLRPDAADRTAVEQDIAQLEGEAAVAEAEYRNQGGGYSLRYPESWYYAEDETKVMLAPSKEDYQASVLRSPMITFISWPLAEATKNFGLEETAAPVEFLQVMAETLGAETGEMESVEISGYPAAFTGTSGAFGDSPYRGDLIIILVEERLFLAEALAPTDQWDDFRPTFVDMVNSLSFFPPSAEDGTARVDYDTLFPLPENVQNFVGEGGESQVNFQTSLTMDEAIAFYRETFAELDLAEYKLLTAIEDESFSMVFTGWPSGEEIVIQGVVFGESTNINIRLEEVVDS
jgi:Tfp pilus assembly protein PilF